MLTSGYGHGIAVTPLHLATAYAALVNGGIWRPATLMRRRAGPGGAGPPRLFRRDQPPDAPAAAADRHPRHRPAAPTRPGFRVGGKTGTAEKVSSVGGYSRSVNVSTFAAAFPMDEPRYVVLAMLDAPRPTAANHGVTTAA